MLRRLLVAGMAAAAVASLSAAPAGAISSCLTTGIQTSCVYGQGTSLNVVVPAGVTTITYDVLGAQGGAGGHQGSCADGLGDFVPQAGGKGGEATGNLPVTPGQSLQVNVGGEGDSTTGAGGFNGGGAGAGNALAPFYLLGGGGGASDIRTSPFDLAHRVIVAGGGGGGGGGRPGGAGGGATGADAVGGGGGGTQTQGGAGAFSAQGGALGLGGSGANLGGESGAGGGGGLNGGGGSGFQGPGGGGSGLASSGIALTQGVQTGGGSIVLTYVPHTAANLCVYTKMLFGPGAVATAAAQNLCSLLARVDTATPLTRVALIRTYIAGVTTARLIGLISPASAGQLIDFANTLLPST